MKQTTPSARKNARILLQTRKKKSVPNFIIVHVISAGYQITHYFLLLLELALCNFFSFSFPFFSFFFPFSTAKVPPFSNHHKSEPEITAKSTKSEGSGTTNAYHLELINLLNVDHVLSDESLKGLARSYQKFLSYNEASNTIDTLIANGQWPASLKKPSG